MKTPTTEQQAILKSKDRIRIVRAAPGSGKTTLVGLMIRKEIEEWTAGTGGISALSFTRVGGEEIRKELGYEISHPHFVGTIDSFLFRYVVRPFLNHVFPTWARPRLLPADWVPQHWAQGPNNWNWIQRGTGGVSARSYNLFNVRYIARDSKGTVLAYPNLNAGIQAVPDSDRQLLLDAKKKSWEKLGWLTHSDAALLSTKLLGDNKHGKMIRSLVLKRFPLIIVDELQDTGFFLASSLRLLLAEPMARASLVGDPNQAIYEFSGARPDLFTDFESVDGAQPFPLGFSQRCPASIVKVATHLKESQDTFKPASVNSSSAYLIPCLDLVKDVTRIAEHVQKQKPLAEAKVVARQKNTIEQLTTRASNEAKSLHCPSLHHLYRAVRSFRQGHNARGLAKTRAAIDLITFGYEGVTDEVLGSKNILHDDWKHLAVSVLLQANSIDMKLSLYDWQTEAGKLLFKNVDEFLKAHSLVLPNKLNKPKKREGWSAPVEKVLPNSADTSLMICLPVQTVHAVKGETHDVTIFVCPEPHFKKHCPSLIWWSDIGDDIEERRIAYVAMTRTRADLIVCLSEPVFARLKKAREAFVNDFICCDVEGFLQTYSTPVVQMSNGPTL